MSDLDDLKRFELSRERGFLPVQDPARELPAEFRRWDEVAAELPKLLAAGRARAALAALPVLDPATLSSGAPLRRAMLVLSYFGHACVWGGPEPERVIPAPIAVPWCAVAARLGRPPVLSYASYALDNWRRLDASGALELDNLAILQNFLGGADEDWFILVHLEIEARAARVLRELGPASSCAAARDTRGLAERLEEVASGIESLCQSLGRMPELCDPYVYYRRVRPYIHGWKDHPLLPEGVIYEGVRELGPASSCAAAGDARGLAERLEEIASGIESLCQSLGRMPELCDPYVYYRRVRPYIHGWKDHPLLPEGVIYEGVRELGERPQRLRGETGAQSGIVPALDAALGVTHAADPLRAYLAEMRDYMPPKHREFLAAVESAPSIRAAVLESSDPDLRAAYDECLRWLEAFRSTHLDYAARYIHQQRPAGAANPTAVGTGGTPFMAYLRKHRDETARHRVE